MPPARLEPAILATRQLLDLCGSLESAFEQIIHYNNAEITATTTLTYIDFSRRLVSMQYIEEVSSVMESSQRRQERILPRNKWRRYTTHQKALNFM
jgi:hypothetical protein